jgi:hypothetical protein
VTGFAWRVTNRRQSDFISRMQAAIGLGHDAAGDVWSGAGRERRSLDGRPVANEACLFNKEGSPEAPFQKHYRFSAEDQEP